MTSLGLKSCQSTDNWITTWSLFSTISPLIVAKVFSKVVTKSFMIFGQNICQKETKTMKFMSKVIHLSQWTHGLSGCLETNRRLTDGMLRMSWNWPSVSMNRCSETSAVVREMSWMSIRKTLWTDLVTICVNTYCLICHSKTDSDMNVCPNSGSHWYTEIAETK